jgi:transcriptional regulator with XRE-family HTH domain
MSQSEKSSHIEKKSRKSEISDAVRKLRRALDETQPVFAKRLGVVMSTLVRYELTRPPRGAVLAHLARIAEEHHQQECAQIFRKALADEIGAQVQPRVDYRSDDEKRYTLGLLATFRNDQYTDLLEKIKKLLEPVCRENDRLLEEFRAAESIKRIIFELLKEGRSIANIVAVTGAPIEAVEQAIRWQKFFQAAGELSQATAEPTPATKPKSERKK